MNTIAQSSKKALTAGVVMFALVGCKTEFDKFDQSIKNGISFDQVKSYLDSNNILYSFLSCSELEAEPGNIKKKCSNSGSKGAFVGWVNNGSYILGIGASDVYFQIEIDPSNKAIEVYTDEVYTFM